MVDSQRQAGIPWKQFAKVLENLPPEKLDNIIRGLDELQERWNNSLSFGGDLTEYYLDGRLDVLVRVRIATAEDVYVLVRPDEKWCRRSKLGVDAGGDFEEGYGGGDFCSDNGKAPMFVLDVQAVKQTEIAAPSLARIEPLDDVANRLSGSLYFSDRLGWQMIVLRENGKARITRDFSAVLEDRRANKVIERGSQIVNTVADDKGPVLGEFGIKRLAVVITNKEVRASVASGGHPIAEVAEVMYGPFDLGFRATK